MKSQRYTLQMKMRIYKISIEEMATLTGLSVADVNKGIEYGSFGAMPEYTTIVNMLNEFEEIVKLKKEKMLNVWRNTHIETGIS